MYAETFREFMSAVEGKATREELEHRRTSVTEETEGRRSRRTSEGEEIPPHGLRLRDGVATYHASLASCVDAPVSVENSCAAGGVGVVTTRRITRGEAIWSEAPLVSIQSPSNVDEALCCGGATGQSGTSTRTRRLRVRSNRRRRGARKRDGSRVAPVDRRAKPGTFVGGAGGGGGHASDCSAARWRNRVQGGVLRRRVREVSRSGGSRRVVLLGRPLSSDGDVREEEASGRGR